MFRRQGSDPSHDHRISPAHLARALGARNFEHRAGLGLPADGHLDCRVSPTERYIFDHISQQLFASGLGRRLGMPDLGKVLSQSQDLRQADIVVLNEVDWGLKRTGYRNVAKELADAMGMNYAYGVEFVEE